MRLFMIRSLKQRVAGSVNPGTPAMVNFIVWLAVLAIVLFMAVSSAG